MTVSEVEQNQQLPCPEQQTPRPDQPQQQKEENKMSNETLVNGGSQQPQNGDPRLEDGKRLLATRKYNEAVDLLGQLAKDLTTKYDSNPLHPELGPVWFLYGQALYQLATSQAPLLGSSVAEEVPVAIDEKALTNGEPAAEDVETAETKPVEDDGDDNYEDVDDNDNEDVGEDSSNDDEEEAEDEDGPEEGGAPNDFEAAWEALETARLIFSKLPDRRMELAEVYLALGDLSLEEERFDQAASDYKDGLVIKQGLLSNDNRELAEIHYKLALALEYQGDQDAALTEMESAMGILRWRLNSLKELSAAAGAAGTAAVAANTASIDPKGKGKAVMLGSLSASTMTADEIAEERNDLEMLLPDIQAKIEELRSSLSQSAGNDATGDAIGAAMMSKSAQPAADVSSAPVVNDLSMLVKKKKAPVLDANNDTTEAAAINAGMKRSADETVAVATVEDKKVKLATEDAQQ